MSTHSSSNYLSQLMTDNGQEKPRHKIKLGCTAYYMKKGIRGYNAQKVLLTEVSSNAARITCPLAEAIEGHFYLVINDLAAKFACVVKKRYEDELEIRFLNDLPAELMERLTTSRY